MPPCAIGPDSHLHYTVGDSKSSGRDLEFDADPEDDSAPPNISLERTTAGRGVDYGFGQAVWVMEV